MSLTNNIKYKSKANHVKRITVNLERQIHILYQTGVFFPLSKPGIQESILDGGFDCVNAISVFCTC